MDLSWLKEVSQLFETVFQIQIHNKIGSTGQSVKQYKIKILNVGTK